MNFLGGEWSGLENPETDISSGPSKSDIECIIPHPAAPGSMLVLARRGARDEEVQVRR